jgi:Fe-S-cluster-containing hydrogenase component 2
LHPSVNKKAVDSIFFNYKKVTVRFAYKMLEGKKVYRGCYDLPIDIVIAPISIAYYFLGRFFIAKTFYASASCDNCSLCIKQCPVKAISYVDNRPYWSYRCESCMHCISICPKRAIETAHGYIFGMVILLNAIMQTYVYSWFLNHHIYWFSYHTRFGFFWRLLIYTAVGAPAIMVSYYLLHYLRKFKFIDWIITYTSLTKLKFWGRYKPPKEFD